jgi:hypothetical protein
VHSSKNKQVRLRRDLKPQNYEKECDLNLDIHSLNPYIRKTLVRMTMWSFVKQMEVSEVEFSMQESFFAVRKIFQRPHNRKALRLFDPFCSIDNVVLRNTFCLPKHITAMAASSRATLPMIFPIHPPEPVQRTF